MLPTALLPAGELHIHARGSNGAESLSSVDKTVWAVRRTCPGTLLGVSTGACIERDEKRTRDCIAAWRELPDYASVNLSERDAPANIALLHSKGIGVEAGLATVADTERFVALAECRRALRILLLTRSGLDWTAKYSHIAEAVAALKCRQAYLDGELCAVRPDGTTSFAALQGHGVTPASLIYFAFDLLHLDGEDLTWLPLLKRKTRLEHLLQRTPPFVAIVAM
jgi:hypothetical protein